MARRGLFLVLPLAVALFSGAAAVPRLAAAQYMGQPDNGILTINPDELYGRSLFGQRMARDLEADSAVLAAENRRIEADLTTEEQDLTTRRGTMDAAAFRALADAFDQKVRQNRQSQDAKARALSQKDDGAQRQFLDAVRPVLENLMREAGAVVILDRATVFMSADVTDITDEAIRRINATIGDGTGLPAQPRP